MSEPEPVLKLLQEAVIARPSEWKVQLTSEEQQRNLRDFINKLREPRTVPMRSANCCNRPPKYVADTRSGQMLLCASCMVRWRQECGPDCGCTGYRTYLPPTWEPDDEGHSSG